jgi:hypothetical protein
MVLKYVAAAAVALAGAFAFVATASAKHQHHAAHLLLGEKINRDGKHELHRNGEHTVHVHVANRKITNLTVTHRTKGNVAVKKFKTTKKVVENLTSRRLVESKGQRQVHFVAGSSSDAVAQVATVYYGYAYFDGTDYVIYWFPADYVVVDSSWVVYTEVI